MTPLPFLDQTRQDAEKQADPSLGKVVSFEPKKGLHIDFIESGDFDALVQLLREVGVIA